MQNPLLCSPPPLLLIQNETVKEGTRSPHDEVDNHYPFRLHIGKECIRVHRTDAFACRQNSSQITIVSTTVSIRRAADGERGEMK